MAGRGVEVIDGLFGFRVVKSVEVIGIVKSRAVVDSNNNTC